MTFAEYDYELDMQVKCEETYKEAYKEAYGEAKIEDAKALLAIGKLTLEEIASCVKLPLEEVQKLEEEVEIMRNA